MMPFSNPSTTPPLLRGSNLTYTLQYVLSSGTCQTQDDYMWGGFSTWELGIMLGLLLVWTVGIFTMWLMTQHRIEAQGRPRDPGSILSRSPVGGCTSR